MLQMIDLVNTLFTIGEKKFRVRGLRGIKKDPTKPGKPDYYIAEFRSVPQEEIDEILQNDK